MRICPSLILASRQTLAMTPQLQQAIKLLQFSHLELAAFIQQELEKNPLLSEGAAISLAMFPFLFLIVVVQLLYIRRVETR